MRITANVSQDDVLDAILNIETVPEYFENRFKHFCFRYIDKENNHYLWLTQDAPKHVGMFMMRSLCHKDNVLQGVVPCMPPGYNAWNRATVITKGFIYCKLAPILKDKDIIAVDSSKLYSDITGERCVTVFVFEKYYENKEKAEKDWHNFIDSIELVTSVPETYGGYIDLKDCIEAFNNGETFTSNEVSIKGETEEYT